MGLSMCTKLQSCHAQEKTIENRVPRNEIRIHSSINCKQMASVNVKMVDHLIITENWLCGLYITTGKSCFLVVLDTVFSNGLGVLND